MISSHQQADQLISVIEREKFSTKSLKAQSSCIESCQKYQEENFSYQELQQIVLENSEKLQAEKKLGFSCTGATPLKAPVRFKARLGSLNLGHFYDQLIVTNQEVSCFGSVPSQDNI